MSQMDKELEAAYAATQARQHDLEDSKRELEAVSAQGEQLASRSKIIGTIVILLCATVGSGILLIDPDSRPWGYLLFFTVVVCGAWSYFKNRNR